MVSKNRNNMEIVFRRTFCHMTTNEFDLLIYPQTFLKTIYGLGTVTILLVESLSVQERCVDGHTYGHGQLSLGHSVTGPNVKSLPTHPFSYSTVLYSEPP